MTRLLTLFSAAGLVAALVVLATLSVVYDNSKFLRDSTQGFAFQSSRSRPGKGSQGSKSDTPSPTKGLNAA